MGKCRARFPFGLIDRSRRAFPSCLKKRYCKYDFACPLNGSQNPHLISELGGERKTFKFARTGPINGPLGENLGVVALRYTMKASINPAPIPAPSFFLWKGAKKPAPIAAHAPCKIIRASRNTSFVSGRTPRDQRPNAASVPNPTATNKVACNKSLIEKRGISQA
jgi:hypothetical protein